MTIIIIMLQYNYSIRDTVVSKNDAASYIYIATYFCTFVNLTRFVSVDCSR